MNLEDVIQIALSAHRGQTERNGDPYILHPLRLMTSFQDEHSRMAAVLHDVVEDTDVTLQELIDKGLPEPVAQAVELLTHKEEDSYDDYLARLASNPMARRVKLADLMDNSNVHRLPEVFEKDCKRLNKYKKAIAMLRALEG